MLDLFADPQRDGNLTQPRPPERRRSVDAARGLTGDDHARGQGHLKSQENFEDDNPERDIPIDDGAEVAGPETIRKNVQPDPRRNPTHLVARCLVCRLTPVESIDDGHRRDHACIVPQHFRMIVHIFFDDYFSLSFGYVLCETLLF
jgi:hypothetical protein